MENATYIIVCEYYYTTPSVFGRPTLEEAMTFIANPMSSTIKRATIYSSNPYTTNAPSWTELDHREYSVELGA